MGYTHYWYRQAIIEEEVEDDCPFVGWNILHEMEKEGQMN